jgi:hypothetical protein
MERGPAVLTPRTLQQRVSFFVLLPVAVLLVSMGTAGFFYARTKLLDQWGEAAMLRLQRAAHQVDMRLDMPKIWLDLYQRTFDKPYAEGVQDDIIKQLKAVDGVSRVVLNRDQKPVLSADSTPDYASPGSRLSPDSSHMGMHGAGSQSISIVVSPSCEKACDSGLTVSLISDLKNNAHETVGSLEAVMPFDYLIETVKSSGWWQSNEAFLVDLNGRILAATAPEGRRQLGEAGDPIEQEAFEALKKKSLGIVFWRP